MLAGAYRFVVLNETGAAFTGLTANIQPWKLDSSGAISYGTEIGVAGISTTLADDAADYSDTIDNSSNKHMGFIGTWTITVGSSQSGTASIYLQQSNDGGTDWPSISDLTVDEVNGILLDVIKLNSQTTRTGQISY